MKSKEKNETITNDTEVYKYNVMWQEVNSVLDWEWKHKTFAQKRDAVKFARARKIIGRKPYPYIVRTVTVRCIFRNDVVVEVAKGTPCRKIIRY